jgi:hypothetical protein
MMAELFLKAEEIDECAIGLVPLGPSAWSPALATGGSVGDRKGCGEEILNRATHGRVIARAARTEKGPALGRPLGVQIGQ